MSRATTSQLPPDEQSPGLARRQVRAALTAVGREGLLDEALLLVTELVTNSVVHAGTAIELRLDTTGDGLRAEVADRGAAVLPRPRASVEDTREGGRGLFLLDALARSWGTSHFPGGKSVWFELGATAPAPAVASTAPLAALPTAPAEPTSASRSLDWLVALPSRLEGQLTAGQLAGELLHRLTEGLGVQHASVLVDDGSHGSHWHVLAAAGTAPEDRTCELVRRAAAAPTRQLSLPGLLVLPLQLDSEPFGALVVGPVIGPAASAGTPPGVTPVIGPAAPAGAPPGSEPAALARLVADRIATVLHEKRTRDARLRSRSSLALLAEASEMFAGSLDVTLAATLLAQLVVPRFAAWSAVYTLLDDTGPQLAAVLDADETRIAPLRSVLSTSSAGDLAAQLVTELAGGRPARRDAPPALGELGSGELLAVPLVARRRLLGMLLLSRRQAAGYVSDEIRVLVDLSRRAALALANASLYEERVAVAQALQASLLPPALPVVAGMDFGARYAAVGEGNEVGGDFYDVFPIADGGWAVAIGDVCGKGPEAAAITGLARNVLRLLTEEGRPSEEVFARLNRAILDLGERGRFCTTVVATLQPGPDGVRVRLCSAGHPPPALLRVDGAVEFVGGGGTLLGVVPDLELISATALLGPGDQLVFYTDGVTERRDGDRWFGDESLVRVLTPLAGRAADRTAGQVEQSVRDFASEGARDDLAVLVVRAAPPV